MFSLMKNDVPNIQINYLWRKEVEQKPNLKKAVLGTIHILRHHIFGIFGPPSPPKSACF